MGWKYYSEINELDNESMTVGTWKCVKPMTYQAEKNGIGNFKVYTNKYMIRCLKTQWRNGMEDIEYETWNLKPLDEEA